MDIDIADIVISLNGRDKGKWFYVIAKEDNFVFLSDGKNRRVEKPKRKKIMHIRLEAKVASRTAMKIKNGEKITNSEIRRSLAEYTVTAAEKGGM